MANIRSKPGLYLAQVLIAIPLLAIVCTALMLDYPWRDTTTRGPLNSPTSWPAPIRELHEVIKHAGINTGALEVYLVHGRPGYTDSTVICRVPDSSQLLDLLKNELELQSVSEASVERQNAEAARLAPPEWWAKATVATKYFASRYLIEGGEGDLYVVAHDPEQQLIFIHYYYNF